MRYKIGISSAVCAAVFALPSLASAEVIELGKQLLDGAPSCPGTPCQAISRTTAFQARAGGKTALVKVPKDGRIVAWSVRLAKPSDKQEEFFEKRLGGVASAGISVIRFGPMIRTVIKGKIRHGRRGKDQIRREQQIRTVAHSPIQQLKRYYGQTAQFPLLTTIAVKKDDIIGITVPTWAPALRVLQPSDTSSSWQASRPEADCKDTTTQTAATRVNGITKFGCLYHTAQLTYGVTLISDPQPNIVKKKVVQKKVVRRRPVSRAGARKPTLGKPTRRR
jgi:hypothetical protein